MDPSNSFINFAVPRIDVIRNFTPCSFFEDIPKELPPGIIHGSIELKARTAPHMSYILSVDGKRVAAGLNDAYGDEDLFGHEVPNLAEKRPFPLYLKNVYKDYNSYNGL